MRGLHKNPIVISTIALAVLSFFIWGLQMTFQASFRIGIIMSAISFIVLTILLSYAFVLYKRQTIRQSEHKDLHLHKSTNISKDIIDILSKMHKRTLYLEKKVAKQYRRIFSYSDYQNLWGNPAFKTILMPTQVEIIDNERKRTKRRKLSNDSIKSRKQVDDVFQHLEPITKMEWSLEKVVELGNLLDRLPNAQNAKYKGIIQRREKDRHWGRLFKRLNKIKVTYADIFTDKDLEKMVNDYIDWSFAGSTLLLTADISKAFIPVDIQPSAFIKSGASNPYITIENRMTQLLEDIANRINELYRHRVEERNGKREKENSLLITLQSWAIGISSMTGYPNKPDGAYWLRLGISVNSTYNKPIDTLDLLIADIRIPADSWPGKEGTTFTVYFNVTDWKWKGENQVELQARINGIVHSSGRKIIDFNAEPGGFPRYL